MSLNNHLSRRCRCRQRSSDLPESVTGSHIALCSVLLRMGFTCAPPVTSRAVVSYTAFPPLPAQNVQAVYFCCTGLGVTSTGRYPASCPMKPGLSSPAAFRHLQPRLSVLLNTVFNYTKKSLCCPLFSRFFFLIFINQSLFSNSYSPSSTIRFVPSAAVVASSSHLSFCGCPSCPFTQ